MFIETLVCIMRKVSRSFKVHRTARGFIGQVICCFASTVNISMYNDTLDICNVYVCVIYRCGNNFCASHRYAESHDCTFDYKTEGRKLLEQNNPVVSAPKLPKI